jgi:excinuclease UvrABC nuclease subunit
VQRIIDGKRDRPCLSRHQTLWRRASSRSAASSSTRHAVEQARLLIEEPPDELVDGLEDDAPRPPAAKSSARAAHLRDAVKTIGTLARGATR